MGSKRKVTKKRKNRNTNNKNINTNNKHTIGDYKDITTDMTKTRIKITRTLTQKRKIHKLKEINIIDTAKHKHILKI